jgi:hypothetical protein
MRVWDRDPRAVDVDVDAACGEWDVDVRVDVVAVRCGHPGAGRCSPGSSQRTRALWLRRKGALALSGEAPLALARGLAPPPPRTGGRGATRACRLGLPHQEVPPWATSPRFSTRDCTPTSAR